MSEPARKEAKARAWFEGLRIALVALLVVIVLSSLALLVLQGQEIKRQGRESLEQRQSLSLQAVQITQLLLAQKHALELQRLAEQRNAKDRARAVLQVAADARRLAAERDRITVRRLQQILDELGRLETPPRTIILVREGAAPAPAPRPVVHRSAPKPTPAPSPKPLLPPLPFIGPVAPHQTPHHRRRK